MVSWWWIPACLFGGTCLGVIIMGAIRVGKWADESNLLSQAIMRGTGMPSVGTPVYKIPPEKWVDREKE
jgi:hypothetical protein